MKKKKYLISLLIILCGYNQIKILEEKIVYAPKDLSMCKSMGYELPDVIRDYELVWSDEFNYEGLPDETKWGYDVGGHGFGNNELQYYTEGENVIVKDGVLMIEARKEDYENNEYTSTRLISKGKGDFRYGKFEISAKLPAGVGTWPAIWMLPTNQIYGEWPVSGEIDILEHIGHNQDTIYGSIHTEYFNHRKNNQISRNKQMVGVSDKFHKYSIEWRPDKISFFIDDEQYFTFKPGEILDCPSYREWPFDEAFHLVLNIAIGGDWGGVKGVDESIFPQTMQIDYVRVYQSKRVTNARQ